MIPEFEENGNLPPGVHAASWEEVAARFAHNEGRLRLLQGMERGLAVLRSAGCRRVFLDGSFVTNKEMPGDYDLAWDSTGVDVPLLLRLDPVFGVFNHGRAAQKAKYLGEYFPSSLVEGGTGHTFVEFFQVDKDTGDPKGVVVLDL
jgi:hypothetical protein